MKALTQEVKFINHAPDDKEWSAHIKLLNEWTTPDRYLREILMYHRSGKHYPTHMAEDLIEQLFNSQLQAREAKYVKDKNVLEIEARIDELESIQLETSAVSPADRTKIIISNRLSGLRKQVK